MKKRILSLALAICLIVTLFPVSTKASQNTSIDYANGKCGKNLDWILSVDGELTIKGYGGMYDFTYKSNVPWDGYDDKIITVVIDDGVTSIGRYAFSGCENLKSASRPDSITTIELWAFNHCYSLESIDLPDSVTKLPTQAFSNCTSLKSVTLPSELTSIGNYAFTECTSLKEITLPSTVSFIGNDVFSNCTSLEKINIPPKVSSFGLDAFWGCENLTSIVIPATLKTINGCMFGRCTGLKEIRFEGDAPSIYERAFVDVSATCYYPAGNRTWTIAKMSDYGGDLTWVPYENHFHGDANGDGTVNSIDAMLVLQYDAMMDVSDRIVLTNCDVTGDGVVNSIDAMLILQFDAMMITEFPAEKK